MRHHRMTVFQRNARSYQRNARGQESRYGAILPVERARRDHGLGCSTLHARVRRIYWKPTDAAGQAVSIPIVGSCQLSQYSQMDFVVYTVFTDLATNLRILKA